MTSSHRSSSKNRSAMAATREDTNAAGESDDKAPAAEDQPLAIVANMTSWSAPPCGSKCESAL